MVLKSYERFVNRAFWNAGKIFDIVETDCLLLQFSFLGIWERTTSPKMHCHVSQLGSAFLVESCPKIGLYLALSSSMWSQLQPKLTIWCSRTIQLSLFRHECRVCKRKRHHHTCLLLTGKHACIVVELCLQGYVLHTRHDVCILTKDEHGILSS